MKAEGGQKKTQAFSLVCSYPIFPPRIFIPLDGPLPYSPLTFHPIKCLPTSLGKKIQNVCTMNGTWKVKKNQKKRHRTD